MAWTSLASPAFATGHVMTQADLLQVTDNLRFLKGTDGAITLDNVLNVSANIKTTATMQANGTSPGMWMDETSAKGAYMVLNTSLLQIQRRATGFGAFEANPFQMNIGAPSNSFVMDVNGWVAMGVGTPLGAFHVVGKTPAAAAKGGMLLLAAAAVTTLQTLAVAGTVTKVASFVIACNQLTTTSANGTAPPTATAIPGGNFILTSGTDTLTIAVTAGGAITVQRTAGAGSDDIILLVLYI